MSEPTARSSLVASRAEELARFVSISAWSAATAEDRAMIVAGVVEVIGAAVEEECDILAEAYEWAMEAEGIGKYQREHIHDAVTQREARGES